MRNNDTRSRKTTTFILESHELRAENFAPNQAIAEFDATILCYMQPSNTTKQQYADGLATESRKVTIVYDEGTLKMSLRKEFVHWFTIISATILCKFLQVIQ